MIDRLCLATIALFVACTTPEPEREASRVTELAQAEDALTEPLMLALAQARNYHHKADVLLGEARTADAIAAIEAILALPFPAGSPEGEDVTLDARARLAKLHLGQGRLDQALAVIDEGLARTTRQSFFLANLYTARGEVLEARAVQLEASDPNAARTSRVEAIVAFDRSIAINKALMQTLAPEVPR